MQQARVDAYMNASIGPCRGRPFGRCPWDPSRQATRQLVSSEMGRAHLPPFRQHLFTQESLIRHLTLLWPDDRHRIFVDLGCHAGHGRFKNASDALYWLDSFNHSGAILGVDAFEDYAQDLQQRFDEVLPYRDMRTVDKRAVHLAIHRNNGVRLCCSTQLP